MEEAAQDKIDLAPRSGPPAWDASSPTKGQIRSPDRLPAMRGSHAAEDAAAEAGPSEVEKLAEQSRRYHAEVDRARAAYAATLTPGQLAAGLLDDIAPHCLATQFRLIGNRGDRRFWR